MSFSVHHGGPKLESTPLKEKTPLLFSESKSLLSSPLVTKYIVFFSLVSGVLISAVRALDFSW